MTKALGLKVFVKPFGETYGYELCVTALDGGGVEASIEELEPCLADLTVVEFPADVKYSQQTVDYKIVYDVSDIAGGSVDDSVFALLENDCINRNLISYTVQIPTLDAGGMPLPIFATRSAYVASQTEQSKERNQDMKVQLTLVPQGNWTYGTTNPNAPQS